MLLQTKSVAGRSLGDMTLPGIDTMSPSGWCLLTGGIFGGCDYSTSPVPAIVTTAPAAPQTAAAMTVPGVWDPGYMVHRTNTEAATNQSMIDAAAQAVVSGAAWRPDPQSKNQLAMWAVVALGTILILTR